MDKIIQCAPLYEFATCRTDCCTALDRIPSSFQVTLYVVGRERLPEDKQVGISVDRNHLKEAESVGA